MLEQETTAFLYTYTFFSLIVTVAILRMKQRLESVP